MTPPSTPKPPEEQQQQQQQQPIFDSPKKVVLPPIQPVAGDGSVVGFFKNAVTKVQNAHSSLDDHLARWFGLNQSKYQWALYDYYESKGFEKGNAKAQEVSGKMQCITSFLDRIDCKRELVNSYSEYTIFIVYMESQKCS